MTSDFSQQVLTEFIANCRERDLIKARLVLSQCDKIDESSQKRILYELSKCDDDFSLPLLLHILVRHRDSATRFPVLPESIQERTARSPLVVFQLLQEKSPDQVAYIEVVTLLGINEVVPCLIKMLESEDDPILQEQIIKSLGMLKAERAASTIGGFLSSTDNRLVESAIDALGKIVDPESIDRLNRLLSSKQAAIRNRAKYRLVEAGNLVAAKVCENLHSNDVDLQIHSLNILKAIGHHESVNAIRQLVNTRPEDANVRFAAYEAMTNLPMRKGDYILAAGLTDPDDSIRLAAARAVDLHLDNSLLNGINNMLNARDEDACRISKAILDSQAPALSMRLLQNESFKGYLVDYLSKRADKCLTSFYLDLLVRSGNKEVADELETARKQFGPSKLHGKICAVDDSKMILKVYQSVLSQLAYEPVLFERPEDYLSWLETEKPKVVFTDLNMPGMTGIELTRESRKRYSSSELPIIMVTTQNESTDLEAAYNAGVNQVILKPFDEEKIKAALEPLTDRL